MFKKILLFFFLGALMLPQTTDATKKASSIKIPTLEQIAPTANLNSSGNYYDFNQLEVINAANAKLAAHYKADQKPTIKHAPLMIFTDPEQKENNDTPVEKLFFTLMLRDIILADWSPLLLIQCSLFEQMITHFHHHLFADLRKKYIFFEIKKSSFVLLVPHWYLLFYQEDHGLQLENFSNKTHLLSYSTIKNSTNIYTWLKSKKEKLSKYDTLDELLINDLRNILISPQTLKTTPDWDVWISGHGEGKHTEEEKTRKIAGHSKEYFRDLLFFFNAELSTKSLYIFSSHVGGSNQKIITKALQKLRTPPTFSCIISDNYETDYKLRTTTELTAQNILKLIPAINVQSTILPSSFTTTIKDHFNQITNPDQNKIALFNNITTLNNILDGQVITPLEYDKTNKWFKYPLVDNSFFVLGDPHHEVFSAETVVPENKRVIFANHSHIAKLTISPFSLHKKMDLHKILQKLQLGTAYINSIEKNDQSTYQQVLTKVFNYAKNEYGYLSNQLQLLNMPTYETFQEDQYLFPKLIFTQTPKDLGSPQECHIKELILKSSQPLMGGIHQSLCDAFTSSRYPFTRIVEIEKMTGFDDISNVVATARTSTDFSHVFYTNKNRRTEIEKALEKQKKERKTDQITIEKVTITTEGNQNNITFFIDEIEYQFEYTSAPFKIRRFYQSENE